MSGWWKDIADGEACVELRVSRRLLNRMITTQSHFARSDNSFMGYVNAVTQILLNVPYFIHKDARNVLSTLPVFPSQIRVVQNCPELRVLIRVGELVPGDIVRNVKSS